MGRQPASWEKPSCGLDGRGAPKSLNFLHSSHFSNWKANALIQWKWGDPTTEDGDQALQKMHSLLHSFVPQRRQGGCG